MPDFGVNPLTKNCGKGTEPARFFMCGVCCGTAGRRTVAVPMASCAAAVGRLKLIASHLEVSYWANIRADAM